MFSKTERKIKKRMLILITFILLLNFSLIQISYSTLLYKDFKKNSEYTCEQIEGYIHLKLNTLEEMSMQFFNENNILSYTKNYDLKILTKIKEFKTLASDISGVLIIGRDYTYYDSSDYMYIFKDLIEESKNNNFSSFSERQWYVYENDGIDYLLYIIKITDEYNNPAGITAVCISPDSFLYIFQNYDGNFLKKFHAEITDNNNKSIMIGEGNKTQTPVSVENTDISVEVFASEKYIALNIIKLAVILIAVFALTTIILMIVLKYYTLYIDKNLKGIYNKIETFLDSLNNQHQRRFGKTED